MPARALTGRAGHLRPHEADKTRRRRGRSTGPVATAVADGAARLLSTAEPVEAVARIVVQATMEQSATEWPTARQDIVTHDCVPIVKVLDTPGPQRMAEPGGPVIAAARRTPQ